MNGERKRALIIGASSPGGLGAAAARRLAGDGAEVVVAGRRIEPLEALAAEIGGRAIVCDVTYEDAIVAALADAGPLDILINAAGTADAQPIAKLKRARIEAQLAIHVTGNMLLLKHAAGTVERGGTVILFSSLTARVPGVGLAAYACAKAALDHLVRIAALEFGPLGISVNAVAPGFSPTPMTEDIFADPALSDLYMRECPLGGRAVTPEEVAAAVAWLADPACFTTGEIVQLSGGAHLGRMPNLNEIREARKS